MKKQPLAVVCGDLHLQDRAPSLRRNEQEWFQCMERQLREMIGFAKSKKVPLILAGDIFDNYNPSARLLNFAIGLFREHPETYAVYGQHDMKNHDPTTLHHTGYGTLLTAGAIKHLDYREPVDTENGICLLGFPWGSWNTSKALKEEIRKHTIKRQKNGVPILSVTHAYAYLSRSTAYEGASIRESYRHYKKHMHSFSSAMLFGDNHRPWKVGVEGGVPAVNTGCMMRRTVADLEREPAFAV